MDVDTLLTTVREDRETERSRLGSSKSLYALTDGEMDRESVLGAMADAAAGSADVYRTWADDEGTDRAAEAFTSVAEADHERHEAIVGKLDDDVAGDAGPLYDHLASVTDTAARAGALLGETMVTDARLSQAVGFFVGDADPKTADLFRDQATTIDDRLADATALLDAVCETDADYETARAAADETLSVAYEEYVDRLEAMGINPKPVC